MPKLTLPRADRSLEAFELSPPSPFPLKQSAPFPRTVYAAAHVVADPLGQADPWRRGAIDWERTLAFRHHLWDLGFKIAEAMDTAQRGMGLDWAGAQELIARALKEAKARSGADLACGVGTDHLEAAAARSLADVIDAFEEQLGFVEKNGGRAIMMASRALAAIARGPEDYAQVYDRILAQAREPVILHWLGDMFDPALAGYWGVDGFDAAMSVVLDIIARHASRIDGIKISLLDASKEVLMREKLPPNVKMYTGDDFNYADLIAGDGERHSHGLLGIFDPIAPAAATALVKLGAGDRKVFDAILRPTVALSRKIFEAPTQYYKAGVVFLAWLNGFQDHFVMLAGMQSARAILHYADVLRLADRARLIVDPERAARRMGALLAINGIGV
ncbi:MAG TPA: dihydrodipicolinate synthase family protein [Roseiarcus sp.]|nr:dihydrodipicolinate synthase family protein [Roseiarcus sp.]